MFLSRIKKLRKLNKHLVLIISLLVTSGLFFVSYGVSSANAKKVTLCHVTGSKTNPFVKITVDQSAKAAHLKHGDFETTANGNCAAPTVTPTNTPTPTNTIPSPTPTNTPTPTLIPPSPTPTNTPTPTVEPPSPTPTNTPTPTPND